MTEDQVRDKAGKILGFQDTETAKSLAGSAIKLVLNVYLLYLFC